MLFEFMRFQSANDASNSKPGRRQRCAVRIKLSYPAYAFRRPKEGKGKLPWLNAPGRVHLGSVPQVPHHVEMSDKRGPPHSADHQYRLGTSVGRLHLYGLGSGSSCMHIRLLFNVSTPLRQLVLIPVLTGGHTKLLLEYAAEVGRVIEADLKEDLVYRKIRFGK